MASSTPACQQPASKELAELVPGDRVRIQGGKNFEKFHGGMEGDLVENDVECKTMLIDFDDIAPGPDKPMKVSYRHLEHAPMKGGYRHGSTGSGYAQGQAKAAGPPPPTGPQLDEHGGFSYGQMVRIGGLQSEAAQALNGRCGRLKKYDEEAARWNVDVREQGIKRLKEENISNYEKLVIDDAAFSVEELKGKGNDQFKTRCLEDAIVYYSAAIDKIEDDPKLPEAEDPKYLSVIYGNRAQCYINLARETQGEETKSVRKETRGFAMRANMDSAKAIELDPLNGKAYYRRGCAMLGMAPSASRAKEAIQNIETALTGRASGNESAGGMVLPNAMRIECQSLLEYAKRRLDACTEAAVPDVEQCREQCRQQ